MKTLLLDTLQVDYLTITYYSDEYGDIYPYLLHLVGGLDVKTVRWDARRLQYVGKFAQGSDGTYFLGSGEQRGKAHDMFQASGAWAQELWATGIRELVISGRARLTRLDVQVTRHKPSGLYLEELYKQAVSSENTVAYIESSNGGERAATLYFGSRSSDRFWRIYEKFDLTGQRLLRAELELKGDVANQLPAHLTKFSLEQIYNHYLEKLPWLDIERLFKLAGSGKGMFVPVRADTNTERWLLETVVPALARFLETDTSPELVAIAFESTLARYRKCRHA